MSHPSSCRERYGSSFKLLDWLIKKRVSLLGARRPIKVQQGNGDCWPGLPVAYLQPFREEYGSVGVLWWPWRPLSLSPLYWASFAVVPAWVGRGCRYSCSHKWAPFGDELERSIRFRFSKGFECTKEGSGTLRVVTEVRSTPRTFLSPGSFV